MDVIEKYMKAESPIIDKAIPNEKIVSVLQDKIPPSCVKKVIEREKTIT